MTLTSAWEVSKMWKWYELQRKIHREKRTVERHSNLQDSEEQNSLQQVHTQGSRRDRRVDASETSWFSFSKEHSFQVKALLQTTTKYLNLMSKGGILRHSSSAPVACSGSGRALDNQHRCSHIHQSEAPPQEDLYDFSNTKLREFCVWRVQNPLWSLEACRHCWKSPVKCSRSQTTLSKRAQRPTTPLTFAQ